MRLFTILAASLLLLAAGTANATGLKLRTGANFQSLSASAIAAQLPQNADDFTALVGATNSIELRVRKGAVDASTVSGALAEFDGWRNNHGGIAAAGGFAALRGFAKTR